jgi:predicted metal-dependent peptidase
MSKKGSCITAEMKKDRIKNEYDYHKYWKDMYEKEKKKRQEAEGEMTIVKGIGQNSPEMKALRKEVEELKANLARAKEDHQFDNLVHQKELQSMRKK